MLSQQLEDAAYEHINNLTEIFGGKKPTAIPIKQEYSFEEPITVQIRAEDGDVLECNHAGATIERVDVGGMVSNFNGVDWYEDYADVLVCNKCEYSHIILTDNDGDDYDR